MYIFDPNLPVHYSFKFAYGQILRAIEQSFYFEAIMIEESILTSRLQDVLSTIGYSQPFDETTLGDLIQFIRDREEGVMGVVPSKSFWSLDTLEAFWAQRNTCRRQLGEYPPKARKMDLLHFWPSAIMAAETGKRLCRQINTWANTYQSIITKTA